MVSTVENLTPKVFGFYALATENRAEHGRGRDSSRVRRPAYKFTKFSAETYRRRDPACDSPSKLWQFHLQ